jgi:hypothetical protein
MKVVFSCTESSDIRVYVIHGIVRTDGTNADLEFQTNARQSLIQELPIHNTSDEEWSISSQLQASCFTCPLVIIAKPQSKSFFPVKFYSPVPCDIQGALLLVNSSTNQRYSYKLQGSATDPLAEGTLAIDSLVMQKTKHTILVKNYSDNDSVLDVICDAPWSFGDLQIVIPANGTAEYELNSNVSILTKVIPKISGRYSKIIQFLNRFDKILVWFNIQVTIFDLS